MKANQIKSILGISGFFGVLLMLFVGLYQCTKESTPEPKNQPPAKPGSPNPANEAVITKTTVTLTWTCSDPENDPLTYDVNFGTGASPAKVSTAQQARTYQVDSLSPGTIYYWGVVAYDDNGNNTKGDTWWFKIAAVLPSLATAEPADITETSATVGGEVTADGGSVVTDYGIYWGIESSPETNGTKLSVGKGTGAFSITLSGLISGTVYYVKAYAVNDAGEALGNEVVFTTVSDVSSGEIIFNPSLTYGSVTDIEGNVYKTIKIGEQTWMAENLRTTTFNDGVSIPNEKDAFYVWPTLTTPVYAWYNNADSNAIVYGALYNWYAAETGKLCPTGWHVPSDDEWKTHESYLGMPDYEVNGINWSYGGYVGFKLKETGSKHWFDNYSATNSSGFTAIGSGYRAGADLYIETYAFYWTSSQGVIDDTGVSRSLASQAGGAVGRGDKMYKWYGNSVRCIKD